MDRVKENYKKMIKNSESSNSEKLLLHLELKRHAEGMLELSKNCPVENDN